MADNKDGGDKTEKPTNKRLRDARKKGDVPKSREVTSTVGLIGWLAVGAVTIGYAGQRLGGLFESVFAGLADPDTAAMARLGDEAFWTLLAVSAAIILPVAAIGVFVEFLQLGAVATTAKMKPDLSRLNPIDGFKRMLSMDNLVEVVKALIKTIVLLAIGTLITWGMMRDIIGLIRADAGTSLTVSWDLVFAMLGWTAGIFIIVSAADAAYQRASFIKKMRMSRRDIKQEMKDVEGDPMIKMKRRELHQEWASQNAAGAARQATALVVNPTHIAVALLYDEDESPVPSVIAKGEDLVALAMREAAEEAGVPILRSVDLARALNARVSLEDLIPADLFDAVAQVIVWAEQVKSGASPGEPEIIVPVASLAPEDPPVPPTASGG